MVRSNMVNCCVIGCASVSTNTNRSRRKHHNITFHEFPSNTNIRDVWIKCTGRQNWEPTNETRMCSKHFKKNRFRKKSLLHPMAVPTLLINNCTVENLILRHQSTSPKTPVVACRTKPTQVQEQCKLLTVMEEEEWSLQRLETFAAAYIQFEILYSKPSPMMFKVYSMVEVQQHHLLSKEFALERLAGTLGLPNNHALEVRCRDFRFQLICYTRDRVRSCALRNVHVSGALEDMPTHIGQLARKLDILWVAIQAELSCPSSPVRRWALHALTQELARAVRLHCNAPDNLNPRTLASASAAVFKGAKPMPQNLWFRLCELRKDQIWKLTLAGDRSDVLCPGERLETVDWELVDALLLYNSDDAMPLVTEVSLHWQDSLRALTVLVELLVAARALRPPPAPPRHRTTVWRSVHAKYTATGRSVSLVLLQRRWQQLLHMVYREPHPMHPLLVLIANSFPRVIQKAANPWRMLVRHGLIATNEDIASVCDADEIPLDVDFSKLEGCKSNKAIQLYIEQKILREHNVYFNGTSWKEKDRVNRIMLYSSDISDSDLEDDCVSLQNKTDRCSNVNHSTDGAALNNPASLNLTITLDSDIDVAEEIIDVDKYVDKPLGKPTKNSQNGLEVDKDTSKIVDYISDVLTEVESLKTLDDLEKTIAELDSLKTFKIMKKSNQKSQNDTDTIKYVDSNGIKHHITSSKTGKPIFSNAPASMDLKLVNIPRVKLKRIDETRAWRRHARHNRIDVKRSAIFDTDNNDNNYLLPVQKVKIKEAKIKSEVNYISDSSTNNDVEIDVVDKYTYDKTSRNPDLNPKLKYLLKSFWNKPTNQNLMKLCKPAVVRLNRLPESEVPRRGRVVKKVELSDIDEVRRINRNILTAQVEPIAVHSYNKSVTNKRGEELAGQAREQMAKQLTGDIKQLNNELKRLFSMPPPDVQDMINASIFDDESDAEDMMKTIYTRRCKKWVKSRQKQDTASEQNAATLAPPTSEQDTTDPTPSADERTNSDTLKEWEEQKIIKNKYFEIGTKKVDSKPDDDLDNLLSCTIIKKPTADADTLETDIATQPFFVSSNEALVASDTHSTPVITEVCSLARSDVKVDNETSDQSSSAFKRPPDTLDEAVKRLNNPRQYTNKARNTRGPQLLVTPVGMDASKHLGSKVVNSDNARVTHKVMVMPTNFTVRMEPINGKKKNDTTQKSVSRLPKQYERFGDSRNELASLTPVIMKDAHTSTITLVATPQTNTNTFTSAIVNRLVPTEMPKLTPAPPQLTVITANPLTTQLIPALAVTPQMSASNTTRLVPTFAMTSQMSGANTLQIVPTLTMKTPVSVTNAQILPTFTIPPQMSVTNSTQMLPGLAITNPPQVLPTLTTMTHGLLPVSANMNIIGFNKSEAELALDSKRDAAKWVEPGRIEPPSALTFNRYMAPEDYINNFGDALTVVKLDSSKPLWTVAEEYLILAEKILPCKEPTYWTFGTQTSCTQLIWPKNKTDVGKNGQVTSKVKETDRPNSAPGIVIENVMGNYKPEQEADEVNGDESVYLDESTKGGSDVAVINLSDSDSDDVQIVFGNGRCKGGGRPKSMLKVKSFAKCERMEKNILELDTTGNPDVLEQFDRYFKKLTDDPVCYSLMLTIVSSTDECDGLLRERAALHVWDRRTGVLSPMDVSAPSRDQLPPRMSGALLVRHADSRFLKDMACKFQQLNSANALVRENQVYVFAPKTGTLLIAPPDNIICPNT